MPELANKNTSHVATVKFQINNAQLFSVCMSCAIFGTYLFIVYLKFQFNILHFYQSTLDMNSLRFVLIWLENFKYLQGISLLNMRQLHQNADSQTTGDDRRKINI